MTKTPQTPDELNQITGRIRTYLSAIDEIASKMRAAGIDSFEPQIGNVYLAADRIEKAISRIQGDFTTAQQKHRKLASENPIPAKKATKKRRPRK